MNNPSPTMEKRETERDGYLQSFCKDTLVNLMAFVSHEIPAADSNHYGCFFHEHIAHRDHLSVYLSFFASPFIFADHQFLALISESLFFCFCFWFFCFFSKIYRCDLAYCSAVLCSWDSREAKIRGHNCKPISFSRFWNLTELERARFVWVLF